MSGPNEQVPFVSIVIPCRNEMGHIVPCLKSLLASEHPRDRMEVIFVDGMSTDGTREVFQHAARVHPFMRLLENPKMIVPTAMNLGIRAARGEIIVRMDAHSEYPADYIPRCLALLRQTRAGNAGGRAVTIPSAKTPWARAVAFVTSHVLGVGNGAYRTSEKPGFVDTVASGTFPRAVLDRVGLFDERLTRNQDNELNARLQKHGYKIAFDPTIRIRYYNQPDLKGLLHQGFYTAMWNVYTLYLHPYTWKWRRFIPAAFVLYLAACPAAAAWAPSPALRAAALLPLALYCALVLVVSAASGSTGGGPWRVAATFVAYHLSYGLGTHFGVVNLPLGRWRRYLGRPLKP